MYFSLASPSSLLFSSSSSSSLFASFFSRISSSVHLNFYFHSFVVVVGSRCPSSFLPSSCSFHFLPSSSFPFSFSDKMVEMTHPSKETTLVSLPELLRATSSSTKVEKAEKGGIITLLSKQAASSSAASTIKISSTPSASSSSASSSQKLILPNYERKGLKESIVHFGVGGFHRSHMAVYIDDLLRQGHRDWSIVGVGLKEPFDRHMRDALCSQDCLYTMVERDDEKVAGRVIGSITKIHFAPEDPELVLRQLSAPDTKIVSMTVTEGGYFLDANGNFHWEHPDIQHDILHTSSPRTFLGYIVEALRRRFESGLAPFTLLSCDNVQGNGDVTRKATLGFARLRFQKEGQREEVQPGEAEGEEDKDSQFLRWMEKKVRFPNSMVDRITPQTTEEDKAFVRSHFGVDDKWPVVTEHFRQWIIEEEEEEVEEEEEERRPPLELVGVQFVRDVAPYELMKLRLLNASHSAMAYLGYLTGHRFVHQVARDPLLFRYLQRTLDREVTHLLPETPGIDLTQYKQNLLQRFSNPTIRDQVIRLCSHGSSKIPKFIIPSISEYINSASSSSSSSQSSKLPRGLTLAVASWIRFLEGKDEEGNEIPIDDMNRESLKGLVERFELSPELFGELSTSELFKTGLRSMLDRLKEVGTRKVMMEEEELQF